ncbi:MAG: phosphate/phosphite/phosphonate ABC transporter substrate-binding protein [Geminicoccaceae bacterium]|nr:phosphate/phosphite/phosphonate ABC transporter substrate-binding protein [Geminicoccaceae bacterium]
MTYHPLVAGLATLLLAAAPLTAAAEFQLDSRYSDADGDLIADIPTDPADWIDPPVLVFAYTPVEDPAVYEGVWADFLDHLSEETGKPVQFFPVQSNAAQIEAMRAGRLHVAGFNTGSNPLAVACAGFRPFAMMAAEDGTYGYRMAIITHVDSGIENVEDIKGRTMAFTAETSNSGYKAPSALLSSKFGMEAGRDFEAAFSGKHDNSVLGVYNKDYDAAAIADQVMIRMAARGVIDQDQIRVIYESDPFPTTGYGVVYNLSPELQEKIKAAFFNFDWEGTSLLAEYGNSDPAQEAFVPITFQNEWSVIREIDAAMDVSYACQ